MVTDAFGSLLQELGKVMRIPYLQPDKNNSCLIKFPNGPSVQIELDRSEAFLLLGCDLGEVARGRYRENVFREALISNGMPQPRFGDFAYSQRTDHLILTLSFPVKNLTGEKIASALTPFVEKAKSWIGAISKNDIPSRYGTLSSRGSGMFGLK
ncbi:putative type III secretion chaperone SycE [Chlamydiales bacterium STE3]|nr:putative type III secretion chaperone SycE [Chlamydiales bacterium STE3]